MFELDRRYEELPWLDEPRRLLAEQVQSGRCPSSLLIHGPHGTGRRELALYLAEQLLGGPALDRDGLARPDFVAVGPEDKTVVSVDQVRELIRFMHLTSHGSGNRVAVIYPADRMNPNSANALLKTLEEPPAGAFLILVCEALSRLPATVLSRCQRVRLVPPPAEAALAWLREQTDASDLDRILEFAGGGPLAALELCESDFAGFAREFINHISALENQSVSPSEVAAACRKQEPLALRLLERQILIRVREGLREPGGDAATRLRAGFRQMDQIRELRRVISRGINAELSLAGLLSDWYGGLGHHGT